MRGGSVYNILWCTNIYFIDSDSPVRSVSLSVCVLRTREILVRNKITIILSLYSAASQLSIYEIFYSSAK